ncbi:MAG TPA: hypothetical protein VNN09_02975 [Candidatus Competibacteraceae bacterium]|nr:hypothetical protein [Candidatus Competibacteraceae bacterium]
MSGDTVDQVHEAIVVFGRTVEKESEDLDYIINKIETGVDFVASQVYETIRQWKEGQVYQNSTLEDLKRKFRLDTFSIDDGWGVFYMYPSRIREQRQQLLKFVARLGTEPYKNESVPAAVERADQTEWAKDLEMDMGVIFALQEVKRIYHVTEYMVKRLSVLENACRKRSEQITSPAWEPKGLL